MSRLKPFLEQAGIADTADTICQRHPIIVEITERFVRFVTPWLVHDGKNLAGATLREAFAGFSGEFAGKGVDYQKFITCLCGIAPTLSAIRVSVPDGDGNWHIWAYEEALTDFARRHGRIMFQIRERETPIPAQPIVTRLLSELACRRELLHLIDHQKVMRAVCAGDAAR
jgi:hypothetical protein